MNNEELENQVNNLRNKIESPMYMVLGFRRIPVDPNNVGMVCELDNPLIFNSLEYAMEVKKKATEWLKEEMDESFEAEIAEIRILK